MLTVFCLQTFNGLFVVADYYTNMGKYTKDCINKDNPLMHCNGKCQMVKKIQQEESKDQQNSERKGDNKSEVVVYIKSAFASVPAFNDCYQLSKYNTTLSFKTTDRSISIFRPPQAC